MKNLIILALCAITWLAGVGGASAIDPADASGTIASTGVYQTIFPDVAARGGCTIQNRGSNNMTIRVAGSTLWTLPPGQAFYCAIGNAVISSRIEITGTATEPFSAARY